MSAMRQHTHWRWHLDEVYVRVQGEMKYLWRAVDHEGEVLESFVTTERDKAAALKFMKKLMKRHGCAKVVTTDGLRSYKAAMKELGIAERQEVGRWANNRMENSHQPFRAEGRRSHPRAGNAPLQAHEDATAVRFRPCLLPQSLQLGTSPRQPPDLQGPTLSRPG